MLRNKQKYFCILFLTILVLLQDEKTMKKLHLTSRYTWLYKVVLCGFFYCSFHSFSQSSDSVFISKNKNPKQDFDFKRVLQKLTGLSDFKLPEVSDTIPTATKLKNRIIDDLKSTTGSIDLNYSYGLNTIFIDTSRSIGSIFTTRGDFSTGVARLPINVSFNYSTLKVPLGANNYFRISLDKDRLIEQQKEKLTGSLTNLEDQQTMLQKKQADLSGLMGYVEVYLDKLKRMAEREAMKQKDVLSQRIQDSLAVKKDSLNNYKPDLPDSLKTINYNQPDLSNPIDYQLYYDSIMKIYNRITTLKNTYDSLSNTLENFKQLLNSYKTQLNSPDLVNKGLKKASFLQSIKTLDIGLTYSKTTAMSSQNVPIKGLHAEFQLNNIYLSVASGLTLNNLMLSTNEINNKMNYNQNVFNNFDFQQIMSNGWLTVIRTGYGTPEGTHAFIGFNYLTNTRFLSNQSNIPGQTSYDPAASFELDLRYVPTFYKGGAIDVVYGKTSLNRQLDTISSMGVFKSVFSNYQSHLFLGKYTQSVSKIHSDFSVTYRRIDPYANTTTFGMMQSNNQRIEINTTHKVAKFMKLGLLYRMDKTIRSVNGMNDLRLNMTGVNISGNYTSYFNYSLVLNHVHHRMMQPLMNTIQRGNNYLIGIGLNSNYELKDLKSSSSISYNDYLITDSSGLNKYTQFGLIQSIAERKYSAAISYDYFFRNVDGVSSGTSVFGIMGKLAMNKLKLGAGLKLSSDFANATSLGGYFEALWQVYKFLDVNLRAERFVLGNFYQNYYRSQYEHFPYLVSIQTRFKL